MEATKPSLSPLRQCMIDDMRMRKFDEKTQIDYVRSAAFGEAKPKAAQISSRVGGAPLSARRLRMKSRISR